MVCGCFNVVLVLHYTPLWYSVNISTRIYCLAAVSHLRQNLFVLILEFRTRHNSERSTRYKTTCDLLVSYSQLKRPTQRVSL